ncbi:hypothetical protein SAXI111661_13305 [Saccharomonospora xinjiangensis]|uniref:Rv2732c family membrane protein n=1 Tax=Saccharomonospora xinjiangensis TaxID=75294 RepID=UPI0010700549|nr:hypothetical protein [Saccharomonospora xinjiangensis]QBQ61380.1 hypothetical protein EYD13_15160 [Saccharomonospora xinjiangensis]
MSDEARSASEGRTGDGGNLDELAADVDATLGKAVRTVEFGRRGFTIAVFVFLLLIGFVLPWVDGRPGWQALLGDAGAIPQLFAATSTGFGVLASTLALATRRWWLTWVCATGGWFAFVDGILAVWSQQSSGVSGVPGAGPGIGLVIACVAMGVLGFQWMKLAWSRH